jgi:hypothetical protein
MSSIMILGLLSILSIICCLILWSLSMSIAIKVAIITLIFATSAYFILRDALLTLPWSWQVVDVDNKGVLTVTNKRGQQFQPELTSSSFIHGTCTILNFKGDGFKLVPPPVILFTNAKNQGELRRLRVWLRWFRHQDDDLSVSDLAA